MNEREVELLAASSYAQENECLLFETSALTGENIENAFNKLVQTIINKLSKEQITESGSNNIVTSIGSSN